MKNNELTEADKAWLCSGTSHAKTKKPELPVIASREVETMLHNMRSEIQELRAALSWARNDWTGNEHSESVMQRYFDELNIPIKGK